MRHVRGRTIVATLTEIDDAAVIGRHAARLSVAALQVLAAVRFDDTQVRMLVSGMHHEIGALSRVVEGLGVDEPDDLVLAARRVLRSGLLATRATLAAVADGSWSGRHFDAAEQACADLVSAQEAFARRFLAGPAIAEL